jgi:2-C-methyl-D-erythritol 4-phosphate cytidylyltransferase / 2-C-methyl-D-erythritol 2,4-cyclodiphosphate synthase
MSLFLIILAGGDGKRLKTDIPKPFNKINNKSLIEYSIEAFKSFKEIKKIIIVYNKKHKKYLQKLKLKKVLKITGGNTRQKSAFNGLKKIQKFNCKKVLIHDAARPNISKELIKRVILKLKKNEAVIPIINVSDAIKIKDRNKIIDSLSKKNLSLAQTPQGFSFNKIYKKHSENIKRDIEDDSALFNKENKISIVKGSKNNFKITEIEDLKMFEFIKKRKILFGIGYDIHKLVIGKKLFLGGINIPFPLGAEGHSDGDPVIHAVIDSILGACRLGDIGNLFSDKNKKYKNIRSTILLKNVIKLIETKNFIINNIDINIIAEKPKIKKYKKKIIFLISKICKIKLNQINIKGKTTEKLGVIGKGKAIASEVITSVIFNG